MGGMIMLIFLSSMLAITLIAVTMVIQFYKEDRG